METTDDMTVAWSVDGMSFRSSGPLRDGLPLGGYVRIALPDGTVRLGQVLEQSVDVESGQRRVTAGGVLLDRAGARGPFDDAVVTPAHDDDVRSALPPPRNPLDVGSLRGHDDIPALLAATGFNRHTFLCGQSGSGKTYSLGVLLERLVLHTSLPLLVLDPNGDHVHLATPAPGVDEDVAADYRRASAGIEVMRADPGPGDQPLLIRIRELGDNGLGALMELDPVTDRHEYNAFVHLVASARAREWRTVDDVLQDLEATGGEVERDLRMRIQNLGIDRMRLWAGPERRTLSDRWYEDRPRGIIADTSGFGSRRERLAVAVAMLTQLWEHRMQRQPLLLVVDEAHDVCPAAPANALEELAVALFTQIAGEGRKYGIHLLLSTQRPEKLPDNVLSQCDNLLLMRVNSAGDRAILAERFSFAPAGLVDMVGQFGLGEALLAGRVARPPVLARIGTRITPEGGSDIPTDWAQGPQA